MVVNRAFFIDCFMVFASFFIVNDKAIIRHAFCKNALAFFTTSYVFTGNLQNAQYSIGQNIVTKKGLTCFEICLSDLGYQLHVNQVDQ